MWFGLDYLMKNEKLTKNILRFTPHTFFIYPIVTIILASLISKLLMKYFSGVHDILTGSRGTKKINLVK